jgi:hypothetical protein
MPTPALVAMDAPPSPQEHLSSGRVEQHLLNAWCELNSPVQQVSEGLSRAAGSPVEPDAEIMQSYPRRQTSSQACHLVRPLTVEQGRESLLQMPDGIAVEIPLASETAPPGEDSQCHYLAGAQGCIGTRTTSLF